MTQLIGLDALPDGLFWTAPLTPDSDFTAEDPLALDYLAQQVGLWLFRGFTTRTNRAQNYPVVLYGLDLADKARKEFGYPGDDETLTRLFERWERFWALATLEYRNGQLNRGDQDAMRGVRGATRAWFPGDKPLPLDFRLISRQNELGNLGAYLSSLRECRLVSSGSLLVTPAAREIIGSFWFEPGKRDRSRSYEEYTLSALNLEASKIVRSHGSLKLAALGKRSRLSSLNQCPRHEQQDRLWNALFVASQDGSTLPLAEKLIAAHDDGVHEAEALLEGLVAGQWGELSDNNKNKIETALAFGRLARVLLSRFNRAYGYVNEHGWVAELGAVAEAAFPRNEAGVLQDACSTILRAHDVRRFQQLQYHGPELIKFLNKMIVSDPVESLQHLLDYHRDVQKSRRGGGAWVRDEHGKLVMQVAGYNGYQFEASFPGMKLNVVRQLLTDLGRLG